MATRVISIRLKPEELAKAFEVLINKGIKPEALTTISSIIRTTFYHGIIALCENPTEAAKAENLAVVMKLLNQNKRSKNKEIKDFLSKA